MITWTLTIIPWGAGWGVGRGVIILRVCGDFSEAKLGYEPRSSWARCWVFRPHYLTFCYTLPSTLEKGGARP